MEQSKIELIYDACKKTREHLETHPVIFRSSQPSTYPKGWCGTASRELQTLLKQHGIVAVIRHGNAHPENIESGDRMNHAWLEYEGYIIDITADQFNDRGYSNPKIMVTRDNSFHKMFI